MRLGLRGVLEVGVEGGGVERFGVGVSIAVGFGQGAEQLGRVIPRGPVPGLGQGGEVGQGVGPGVDLGLAGFSKD